MKQQNMDAVSPVVGVMLMLVVTIIIAAVVSAFSGGLAQTTQKAPSLTATATYSQSNGLAITHMGGDGVDMKNTNLYLHADPSWGSAHVQFAINKTALTDASGAKATKFQPGNTFYLLPPWSQGPQLQPSSGAATGWFNNTENVGKVIILEISDTKGQMITSTKMIITP